MMRVHLMPYSPVSIVKAILTNRHKINNRDQIKEICSILFDLALRDSDAAETLFAEPNRFIQIIPDVLSKEKLLKFAHIHNEHLVEKLINLAKLSNVKLVQEMRQAALIKQNRDQQFNALLQRTQPIEREPILPVGQKQQNDLIGRTHLAIQRNPLIRDKNNTKGIMLHNEFIPMVTRHTRDFSKKLCSLGASISREAILLDPDDPLLKTLYEQLQKQLPTSSDPQVILEEVKKLTRSCFTGKNVDSLVKENLRNGKQIISLSEFILRRQGVCRHHTLLNAYLLSRLVQDGLLLGEVIHHRQDVAQNGAHAWNVFRAQNGKVYSLDSLWNDVTCITDNPGAINSLYRHNVEEKIKEMHFSAPQQERQIKEQRENLVQDAIIKKPLEIQKQELPFIQNYLNPLSPPPNTAKK
jgi:hypothetical protein